MRQPHRAANSSRGDAAAGPIGRWPKKMRKCPIGQFRAAPSGLALPFIRRMDQGDAGAIAVRKADAVRSNVRRSAQRAGPVVIAMLLGLVLVLSSMRSYRDARLAIAAVAERAGIGFFIMLNRRTAGAGIHPSDLPAAVEAFRPFGLAYCAIAIDGEIVAESGEPLLAREAASVGNPAIGNDRVRMVGLGGPGTDAAGLLPRRVAPDNDTGGEAPPLGAAPVSPNDEDLAWSYSALPLSALPPSALPDSALPGAVPSRAERRHRPYLVIEFEPTDAHEILRRAVSVLWLSTGAAILLTAAALISSSRALRADRLELELSKQRHLAQLGHMAAVLAHEIRNPLASLKGHAQLLSEKISDPALTFRIARVVKDSLRLEELTDDLLDFARPGALDIRMASPGELLARAVAATEPERIELSCEHAPSTALLDPGRIEQVLINLIENALAATPQPLKVHAEARSSGGDLVLAIRDHGPGVPVADRERIFEPFHTTKVHGTGLGLSIVKKLVERHNGMTQVLDAAGGGTEFRVVIPQPPAPSAV